MRLLKSRNLWVSWRLLSPAWGRSSKGNMMNKDKAKAKSMDDFLGRRLGRPFAHLQDLDPSPDTDPTHAHESSPSKEPVSFHVMDGRLLKEYASKASFNVDAVALWDFESEMSSTSTSALSTITRALASLTVEQGIPPCDDPWVTQKIINPALESAQVQIHPRQRFGSVGEFVQAFRNVVLDVSCLLEKNPVTVATTHKTFDGKRIAQFLPNKHDLDEALHITWKSLPKDSRGAMPREYLRVALDIICPAARLPSLGAFDEMDRVYAQSFIVANVDSGGAMNQKEFNKSILEMLRHIMNTLQRKPVHVSCTSVLSDKSADPPAPAS